MYLDAQHVLMTFLIVVLPKCLILLSIFCARFLKKTWYTDLLATATHYIY